MTHGPAPASPGDFEPLRAPGDIKERSVRGGIALALAQGGAQVIRIATLLVLARVLAPADFGLIAMVSAIVGLAQVVQDLGLTSVTVQRPQLTAAQASSLFWLRLGASLLAATLCVGAAPLIAAFYGDPRAVFVSAALAAGSLISSLGAQHRALLQRTLRFGELSRIGVWSVATAAAGAVALSVVGAGHWALVGYALIEDALGAWLAWRYCDWRPTVTRMDAAVKEMVRQGSYVIGFAFMTFVGRNVHNILVGRSLGPESAGWASRAFGLVALAQSHAGAAATVAISSLSGLQDQAAVFRRYYLKALSLTALPAIAAGAFGSAYASGIVRFLLGEQWDRSAGLLQALMLCLLVHPVTHSSGWLFQARGRMRELMRWGFFGWGVLIACIATGLQFGLEGMAIAYTAGVFALAAPNMIYAVKSTDVALADILRCWWPLVTAAALALLPAIAVASPVDAARSLGQLALAAITFGLAYLAILTGLFRQGPLLVDALSQLRPRGSVR